MASKTKPVVLVPGILGSELVISGTTVWANNFNALKIIMNPSLLLPWVPADAQRPISQYDGFINFLESEIGYQIGVDLFPFGYDWRTGIEPAASALAQYIEKNVRMIHGGPIVFIAHSFGCLVVRWAIVKGLIKSNQIELVVAAGPPSLGGAKAFKSVLEMPSLSDTFDALYNLAKKIWPSLARRIEISFTKTIMALTSLLVLMPPRSLPILKDCNSSQVFSTFEWPGWPVALSNLRTQVESAQAELQNLPWPPVCRKLIASVETPTEITYLIDFNRPFGIIGSQSDAGDGRVWIESARYFGSDETEMLVKSKHDSLLDDDDVKNWLRQRL